MASQADIVVIGSGIGGATVTSALAQTGKNIVVLERGEYLHDCKEARDESAIFAQGFFRPEETWLDGEDQPFNPGNYYYVGGNSKFYGCVLLRFRREDFDAMQHIEGISPAWPISYQTLEPWYQQAETLFQVCGTTAEDPTEPPHSGEYPLPPVADEADIKQLRTRLQTAGVAPAALPLGIDVNRWLQRASTPWDAFPDTTNAKVDAQTLLQQALAKPNVTLITGAQVKKLMTGKDGEVTRLIYDKNGQSHSLDPKLTILSAGAVNSAALLLRSANDDFPNGLANRSDQVGRNFMNHNCSAIMAMHAWRKNRAVYQKTLQFNDFYLRGGGDNGDLPLGNAQLLGKISGTILAAQSTLPLWAANFLARRSVDWYVMSEDLPNPHSRVTVDGDNIRLDWRRSNMQAHRQLLDKVKAVLRRAGYPILLSRPFDRRTPSHQCGTTRFGHDPGSSVLDTFCRSHEHRNLLVVDAGFLPCSAAVNPALTIAAQALRVAQHIQQEDLST